MTLINNRKVIMDVTMQVNMKIIIEGNMEDIMEDIMEVTSEDIMNVNTKDIMQHHHIAQTQSASFIARGVGAHPTVVHNVIYRLG